MGKLHTLRRAILREPEKWKGCGARFDEKDGQWKPVSYRDWFVREYKHLSYKTFVKRVLNNRTFDSYK